MQLEVLVGSPVGLCLAFSSPDRQGKTGRSPLPAELANNNPSVVPFRGFYSLRIAQHDHGCTPLEEWNRIRTALHLEWLPRAVRRHTRQFGWLLYAKARLRRV